MKTYRIRLDGCDDHTDVKVDLDEHDAEVVCDIARRINTASEYPCMPTMRIAEGGDQ